jgi:hypothetical protein
MELLERPGSPDVLPMFFGNPGSCPTATYYHNLMLADDYNQHIKFLKGDRRNLHKTALC